MKYKFNFFGVLWFFGITLFNLDTFWIESCTPFNWFAMSLVLLIINIFIGLAFIYLVKEKDVDNKKRF